MHFGDVSVCTCLPQVVRRCHHLSTCLNVFEDVSHGLCFYWYGLVFEVNCLHKRDGFHGYTLQAGPVSISLKQASQFRDKFVTWWCRWYLENVSPPVHHFIVRCLYLFTEEFTSALSPGESWWLRFRRWPHERSIHIQSSIAGIVCSYSDSWLHHRW